MLGPAWDLLPGRVGSFSSHHTHQCVPDQARYYSCSQVVSWSWGRQTRRQRVSQVSKLRGVEAWAGRGPAWEDGGSVDTSVSWLRACSVERDGIGSHPGLAC